MKSCYEMSKAKTNIVENIDSIRSSVTAANYEPIPTAIQNIKGSIKSLFCEEIVGIKKLLNALIIELNKYKNKGEKYKPVGNVVAQITKILVAMGQEAFNTSCKHSEGFQENKIKF